VTAGNAPSCFTGSSTIGWTHASRTIGIKNRPGTAFELRAIYLEPTARADLNDAANRARSSDVTAGNLDILTRGDGVMISIPQVLSLARTQSGTRARATGSLDQRRDKARQRRRVRVMSRSG
jgi:hypothetical protein